MSQKSKNRRRRILRNFRRALKSPKTYLYMLIPFIVAFLIMTTYRAEEGLSMSHPSDGIWHFLIAFTAGYFDFVVESHVGRICSFIMLISGIMIFSTITGKIASIFMNAQLKKDRGLAKLKDLNKHFILCGYKNGLERILDTVLTSNPDLEPDMIVLVNDAPSEAIEQIRNLSKFKGINYVSGDFSDEETLQRAQIKKAERALIISDTAHPNATNMEVDSRTVLSAITMKNLNPKLYVAAELYDAKFSNHLKMAHCDEIILTSDYEYSLLATASSGMGYSNVISALIGDDAYSGILIENIKPSFVGKTYAEYKASLKTDSILIGLLLNTGNFYQRRKDALREAQKNPDMKKVVDNLRKVKSLKSNEPFLAPPDDFVIPLNTKAIFVKGKHGE